MYYQTITPKLEYVSTLFYYQVFDPNVPCGIEEHVTNFRRSYSYGHANAKVYKITEATQSEVRTQPVMSTFPKAHPLRYI